MVAYLRKLVLDAPIVGGVKVGIRGVFHLLPIEDKAGQ